MLNINRKNGIPIYIQVKEQLREFIQKGIWESGFKLPTERDLAEILGISRNTVSAAYKDLEAEGYLVSQQGRGTFVRDIVTMEDKERLKEELVQLIDDAIDRAVELGFEIDEFVVTSHVRAKAKKEVLNKIQIAFVECNHEQLDYFCRQLHLGAGVILIPILLQDFVNNPVEINRQIDSVDLVVTTFFHIDEVRSLLADDSKEVLGISLDPQLETVVKIAKIPKHKRVGLLCISNNFARKVITTIENAGINEIQNMKITTSRNEQELLRFVKSCDVIITSPGRKKDIEKFDLYGKDVIEFVYLPDLGSINILRTALYDFNKNKLQNKE
jgi:GntR family transcriptional regulator